MPSILPPLTSGQKRSIAKSMIPKFIKWGFSRNKALAYLKFRGHGVRRKWFLKLWSMVTGIAQKQAPLKHVRRDTFPTPDVITLTEERQRQKYNYTYKISGFDKDTGEKRVFHLTIGTQHLRKMGAIDATAKVIGMSTKCGENMVIEKIEREAVKERTVEY